MLIPSPLQKIETSLSQEYGVELWIKRDDLIHSDLSGNKYRKLKYNLRYLKEHGLNEVITFGGAHSNHIAAMAFLCKEMNIQCTGIIRGEQPVQLSPTLKTAQKNGMTLKFVSRSDYKLRNDPNYLKLLQKHNPKAFFLPEGGANQLGVKGCEEIVIECQNEFDFDYITVDCGTGATLAGMVRKLKPHQRAIGVQVLKGDDFITPEVEKLNGSVSSNFEVWTDYHFGGYAKYKSELIDFMRSFFKETGIKLDPVYTGKQFYAVMDQIQKGFFPKGSKIILTHTGGLQGIRGFEERYGIVIYP